jgi:hypothetical protein
MGTAGEPVDQDLRTPEARVVADTEDRAQDHIQCDPLGMGAQRERHAHRPALHVALGDLADRVSPALDVVTVEGRQQQLAVAHVRFVVEREQRVRSNRGLENGGVGFAGVEDGRITREDLLDEFRLGDVDHQAKTWEPTLGHRAVAPVEGPDVGERVPCEPDRVDQRGPAWPWRELARGHGRKPSES